MKRAPSSKSSAVRSRLRGFTLVELMVALSGGLFLSIMVFALARDTSRFYVRENRVAAATLTGMVGFERLKADIARAGYLSTPNIIEDPKVCVRPQSDWPLGLRTLGSLRINLDQPAPNPALGLPENARTPDEIVLAGSYATTDEFPIRAPEGTTIHLQRFTGPMARIGYHDITDANEQATLLASIFGAGRILRLVDHAGFQHFGVIDSVEGGDDPRVILEDEPALQIRGTGNVCGIRGFETGASASVINVIRYQIRDVQAAGIARFAPLFAASAGEDAGVPGEATRTELVREELDANGTVIDGTGVNAERTLEIAAEYAVDLAFSVTAQLPGTSTAVSVTDAEEDAADFDQVFDPTPDNSAIGNPQGVRAVRVRLSVRSREADRPGPISGGFFRFKLPDGDWARVRTFQADVALPNQADVRWGL